MIGARLKLARTAAGHSLRQLESALGGLVTAQAIGKYERDEMMPSSTVLIALAKTLGVTEDYLLNPADVELVAVEFRKKKLTSAREAAEVRARILSEVERYLEVEAILAIDGRAASAVPTKTVHSLDDAEDAAGWLRDEWKLGQDPIPNLCEFLEEKGVKVCALPLPESVSGVQANVTSAADAVIQVIVVNAVHPGERQRFTLAHELGHLCLKAASGVDIEDACNRFAGALLMPRALLEREVGKRRSVIWLRELFELKLLFGVSAQAVAYRCRDIGIMSQQTVSDVFRIFTQKKWRKVEPVPLNRERPARFERLCLRALAEGLISESKAAELLKKTTREILASLNEPPQLETGDARAAGQ